MAKLVAHKSLLMEIVDDALLAKFMSLTYTGLIQGNINQADLPAACLLWLNLFQVMASQLAA